MTSKGTFRCIPGLFTFPLVSNLYLLTLVANSIKVLQACIYQPVNNGLFFKWYVCSHNFCQVLIEPHASFKSKVHCNSAEKHDDIENDTILDSKNGRSLQACKTLIALATANKIFSCLPKSKFKSLSTYFLGGVHTLKKLIFIIFSKFYCFVD